jgi:hypothetical protein
MMRLRANGASVRLRVVITSRVTSYGQSHGLADDHGVGPCRVYTRHPIDTMSPFGRPRTTTPDFSERNERSIWRPPCSGKRGTDSRIDEGDGWLAFTRRVVWFRLRRRARDTHLACEIVPPQGWIGSRAGEDSTQGGVR